MTGDYQTDLRVSQKQAAIPFPDFNGKTVLDVGTDFGHWAFTAARAGARRVVGLDRNRTVRGAGQQNLVAQNNEIARSDSSLKVCRFHKINIGKEWFTFGRFDVVLLMSVYHHVFNNCGDHRAIWFWLSQHCDGQLLFEGPVDDTDPVVRANVSEENRKGFTLNAILEAAGEYFDHEFIGPSLHEPTRWVYRFTRKDRFLKVTEAVIQTGAGGATKAFEYADGRRIKEIRSTLGFKPFPGSLNLRLDGPFNWDVGYYRAQILDVVDRERGFDSEWAPRWARFYPVEVDGFGAFALRFEGEKYNTKLMELIAVDRLRDVLTEPRVTITR